MIDYCKGCVKCINPCGKTKVIDLNEARKKKEYKELSPLQVIDREIERLKIMLNKLKDIRGSYESDEE